MSKYDPRIAYCEKRQRTIQKKAKNQSNWGTESPIYDPKIKG